MVRVWRCIDTGWLNRKTNHHHSMRPDTHRLYPNVWFKWYRTIFQPCHLLNPQDCHRSGTMPRRLSADYTWDS